VLLFQALLNAYWLKMTTEKTAYVQLCATAHVPIFMQNWWLDAVCTEGWSVVLVYNKNEEIEAALAFAIRRKFGLTTLSEPLLSPFCGVWFRQETFQKQHEAIAYRKQNLEKLIQKLPFAHRYSFRLQTSLTDWQPFYWAGWQQETRYTYRLNIQNLKTVADNFNDNTKRNIQKASKNYTIESNNDFDKFLEINALTYQRQNIEQPIPLEIWQSVERVLSEKNQRHIFFARNTEGSLEAAIYVIFDISTAYYLAGGATEVGRSTGAMHGLLGHAIQEASKAGCTIFDFEGSMLRGVEPFFRGFGGELTPYFRVFKFANRFLAFVLGK
jgi:lipid II:glycine glycyltransferase (peptidoglycan interpeptide bridge formation enzyme)